jgi:CubicO group peptidase (beta-lactamase class C family)
VTAARRAASIALLASAVAGARPLAAQGAPPGWPALTRTFDAYVQSDRIVGASLAWVDGGRIVARHHIGMADLAAGRAVDDSTLWHWASITKTLTAVSVLQLRDRGLLTLDQPITSWVPELRQVHDPYGPIDAVTLRMLLSHSSGFQNPTWPYGSGAAWEPFEPTAWSQLVAMMPWQELRFAPGSRYGYSNPAFIYLARVIEAFTGDPWAVYVQKNLWTPLGMTRSYVNGTPPYPAAHRSNRYHVEKDGGGTVAPRAGGPEFDPGVTIPNGGWNGPVDDVATWIGFLTGRAAAGAPPPTLIARATLAEMWTPVVPVDSGGGIVESMGLGFFLFDVNGHRLVGHTGDQGGFRSFMAFDPVSGKGVIGVVNTSNDVDESTSARGFTAVFHSALNTLAQ